MNHAEQMMQQHCVNHMPRDKQWTPNAVCPFEIFTHYKLNSLLRTSHSIINEYHSESYDLIILHVLYQNVLSKNNKWVIFKSAEKMIHPIKKVICEYRETAIFNGPFPIISLFTLQNKFIIIKSLRLRLWIVEIDGAN